MKEKQAVTFFSIPSLAQELKEYSNIEDKLEILQASFSVQTYFKRQTPLKRFIAKASREEALVIYSIIAIGQDRIFAGAKKGRFKKGIQSLLQQLLPVEKFYAAIGGLVGYQARMLDLLSAAPPAVQTVANYHPGEGMDISVETDEVRRLILDGIKMMPKLAEIYPVGGAADRLRLQDERTGEALPAARLPFLGKTLLEGMISDLQSREYLHYKIFDDQLLTPIAMMTSHEKNNHEHILSICEDKRWFGRPKESFRFFCQPSVPTVNRQGEWCLLGPMQLFLKPGGHGVIWRLARDEGIFDWFFAQERNKVVVRQINNPVANTDYGILAFTGIGCREDKIFGFASCPRQVKASEGINVVIETPKEEGNEYVLTNIEYCDFKKYGIVDQPVKQGSPYSKFSSNTNILFADLRALLNAIAKCPIPGILVNLKKLTYRTENGQKKEEEIARLESTMQNIADFFTEMHSQPLLEGERHQLKTFLTYNERRKTISAAKREFALGASLLETPEGCFLDILKNGRELLKERCGVEVPEVSDPTHFFRYGPSFIFLYHPALGPLYSIIAQKIRGGCLYPGSELQLEIAEADIENLDLIGSLLIHSDAPMGHFNENGVLTYSEKNGKCILKNVLIRNEGIDFEAPNVYWKNEIIRHQSCHIFLHGNGEFYAENVVLSGDLWIEVNDGEQVVAKEVDGKLQIERKKISSPTWHWKYTVDQSDHIKIAHH